MSSSSNLHRESVDGGSTTAVSSNVERLRALFSNNINRMSAPRTTPEFFQKQLRKQVENDKEQRDKIREQTTHYRLSLRALTVAVPRRISEMENSARKAATDSRTHASRLRLSIGGIMGSKPKHERDGMKKSVRGRFTLSRSKAPSLASDNPLYGVKESAEEAQHALETALDEMDMNVSDNDSVPELTTGVVESFVANEDKAEESEADESADESEAEEADNESEVDESEAANESEVDESEAEEADNSSVGGLSEAEIAEKRSSTGSALAAFLERTSIGSQSEAEDASSDVEESETEATDAEESEAEATDAEESEAELEQVETASRKSSASDMNPLQEFIARTSMTEEDVDSASEAEDETESASEAEDEAESASEAESEDESATEAESEAESATEAESEAESASEAESEDEADDAASESEQESEVSDSEQSDSITATPIPLNVLDKLGDMGTSNATLDPEEVDDISDSEVEGELQELKRIATSSTQASVEEESASDVEEDVDTFDLMDTDLFLRKLESMKQYSPENLACKVMTRKMFESYSEKEQVELKKIMESGVEFPDSKIGCYAVNPSDLDVFEDFFDPLIAEYHNLDVSQMRAVHDTSMQGWDLNGDQLELPSNVEVEIRASRNVIGHDMCGNMNKVERLAFEDAVLNALDELAEKHEIFNGTVYSLSPQRSGGKENPNFISEQQHAELAAKGLMFEDLEDNPFLVEAQFTADYPYGRGAFVSSDESLLVWYGGEDHLEIVSRGVENSCIAEILEKLQNCLTALSTDAGLEFVVNDRYGYVTACPSKLGTGLQFSAKLKLPSLTAPGESYLVDLCENNGLDMLPVEGELSSALITGNGTVKVSPVGGLFVSEREQALGLYYGVEDLLSREARS